MNYPVHVYVGTVKKIFPTLNTLTGFDVHMDSYVHCYVGRVLEICSTLIALIGFNINVDFHKHGYFGPHSFPCLVSSYGLIS